MCEAAFCSHEASDAVLDPSLQGSSKDLSFFRAVTGRMCNDA